MSTQYGNQGGTGAGATGGASNAGAGGQAGGGSSTSGATGAAQSAASNLNWGSARSDYGDEAYGGTLDQQGLGGSGYDDFNEGRRDAGSRGESSTRGGSARSAGSSRDGYGLGNAGSTGLTLLAGMVIGATLMYLLDPERGGRRRALLRDKLTTLSNGTTDILGKTSRDLRDRAQGIISETTRAIGLGGQGDSENEGAGNAQASGDASSQRASAAGA